MLVYASVSIDNQDIYLQNIAFFFFISFNIFKATLK